MKKGFTLVEMLGVIVIVGLIVLLVVPFVTTVINNSKQKMYEQQLKNIELAAKTWGSENIDKLPTDGKSITIFLHNLKYDGFISKEIQNPVTNENIPDDIAIQITRKGDSYIYKVLEDAGGEILEYNPIRPRIIFQGALEQRVEINSEFTAVAEDDILIIDDEGEIITSSTIDITITEQNLPAVMIETTEPKIYFVEYKINYDGFMQNILRIVTIADTIPPVISFVQPTYLLLVDCPTFDVEEGVTVTDNSESWNLDVSGTLECNLGEYSLSYTATDMYGNVTEKKRTIRVVEQLAGGEEPTGDIVEENANVAYINHPTAIGYPDNATPCTINTFDFTHIKDKRDETIYPVTKIGTQCWFSDNLIYTTGACLGATWNSDAPHDACATHEYNGRMETFYQWAALMDGSVSEGAQGLCPVGWHIPTDAELHALENFHSPATCDSTRMGWDCSPGGQYLKADRTGYNGTDFYGFNGGLAGMVNTFGSRTSVGTGGVWWSSSTFDATSSRHRFVSGTNTGVTRGYYSQANGIAGRCLMNP